MLISLKQFLMPLLIFSFRDIPLPGLLRGFITDNIPVDYRVLFLSLTDIIRQSINASATSQEIDSTAGVPPAVVEMEEESPSSLSSSHKSAVGALGVLSQAKS